MKTNYGRVAVHFEWTHIFEFKTIFDEFPNPAVCLTISYSCHLLWDWFNFQSASTMNNNFILIKMFTLCVKENSIQFIKAESFNFTCLYPVNNVNSVKLKNTLPHNVLETARLASGKHSNFFLRPLILARGYLLTSSFLSWATEWRWLSWKFSGVTHLHFEPKSKRALKAI